MADSTPTPSPITEEQLQLVIEAIQAVTDSPARRGKVTITIINGCIRFVEPSPLLDTTEIQQARAWLWEQRERAGRRTR